ncbi:MAG TPA: hypothetical protein VKP67_28175 [Xanthobacteraceae bacterium]|nr:hypothetical protein [Xanthobacteraceae bacterium]
MTETALSSAMKRAGLNVAASALYIAAAEALCDRSLPEALRTFTKHLKDKPALLDALALPFLRDVQNDMKNKPGHDQNETQTLVAGPGRGQRLNETQAASVASVPKGGQTSGDAHASAAAAGRGLAPVSAGRREAAKRAARAEVDALDPIFKRRIGSTYVGNLKCYELQEIARNQSLTAAQALERGVIATENFFLCIRLSREAIPSSDDARVRDIVNARKFAKIFQEAQVDAAEFIAAQEKRHVHSMQSFDRRVDAQNAQA